MPLYDSGGLTYEGVSFQFGEGTPAPITGFVRGVATGRYEDRDVPRHDRTVFGIDLKAGATHELGLLLLGAGETSAEREHDVRAQLGRLAATWSANRLRSRPGELAELRVGDRSALGRPRDFTPDDASVWDGASNPVLKFAAMDDLWYGPEETTAIRFTPIPTGGLPVPAEVPFVLGGGAGESDYAIDVRGDVETWPEFTLKGPIQDPWIEIVGVGRLRFAGTFAYDQSLIIRTRPGAAWITANGNPVPGALKTTSARLSDMSLTPGLHRVMFGGYDPSGTSQLLVRVRPAFTTL